MPFYHYYSLDLKTGEKKLIAWGGSHLPKTDEDIERHKRLYARDHPGKALLIRKKLDLQTFIDNTKVKTR